MIPADLLAGRKNSFEAGCSGQHELSNKEEEIPQESNELEIGDLHPRKNYSFPHNATKGILSLPNELTCEILLRSRGGWVLQRWKSLPMELILCKVCSQWRNVARQCPPFWAAFSYIAGRERRIPLSRLKFYLAQSRDHPLDLVFKLEKSTHRPHRYYTMLFELAADHAYRWRSLRLTWDRDIPTQSIFPCLALLSLPNLEYLELSPGTYQGNTPILPSTTLKLFAGGTPKLSYVSIDEPRNLCCMPPLKNITTLRIEGKSLYAQHEFPSFGAFLSLLSSPFLTNLSLEKCYFESLLRAIPKGVSIAMPYLKSLRLSSWCLPDKFLFCLDAPLLRHLILCDSIQDISPFTVNCPLNALKTLIFVNCSSWIHKAGLNLRIAELCPNIDTLFISCNSYPFVEKEKIREQVLQKWTALQTFVLDLQGNASRSLDIYLKLWCNIPITIRVRKSLFETCYPTIQERNHVISTAACTFDFIEACEYQSGFFSSRRPGDELFDLNQVDDIFYDKYNM